MKIAKISAREILDSRGNPTVEADVILEDGSLGRAAVPSGASTGSREALEVRDHDATRYGGNGVLTPIRHIQETIAPALMGKNALEQKHIDDQLCSLDGTNDKSMLGGNALLAVSLATAKAAAAYKKMPLHQYIATLSNNEPVIPVPLFNIMNGGKHADGSTDIQECMIIPTSAQSFADAYRMGAEVYHALKIVLSEHGYATTLGDEGGFAPPLKRGNEEALRYIETAIQRAGYQPGIDISLALDVAASELLKSGKYALATEKKIFDSNELVSWYQKLAESHPIVSIEDGLDENDWDGWELLMQTLGSDLQIVGDDLLVTNTEILRKAIERKAANAILIKPNQIGTLSETIKAVSMAHDAGWRTIMSHRSGETEDTTIAHLAVGLGCSQIKSGAPARGERTAKYNELLRICEESPEILFARQA